MSILPQGELKGRYSWRDNLIALGIGSVLLTVTALGVYTQSTPVHIQASDINEDGIQDLVMENWFGDRWAYLGSETGEYKRVEGDNYQAQIQAIHFSE